MYAEKTNRYGLTLHVKLIISQMYSYSINEVKGNQNAADVYIE